MLFDFTVALQLMWQPSLTVELWFTTAPLDTIVHLPMWTAVLIDDIGSITQPSSIVAEGLT